MSGPTLTGAIERVTQYLAAFPEDRILGRRTAFGHHFRTEEWPNSSYPLRREDIELLLDAARTHHTNEQE